MAAGDMRPVVDALEALYVEVQAEAPELHVFRWWRPDMALPAIYTWLTPGSTDRPDTCTVRDRIRFTPTIAVDPTDTTAGDLYALEALVDIARAVMDPVIYGPQPLGATSAKRLGIQTAAEQLGEARTILVAELPIEVELNARRT